MLAFMSKWIEFFLVFWSLEYSLECYSLLKQCFQKGQSTKSTWWSPLQLRHLNEWGHGLPFLISSLRGFNLLLALQHQAKWWWWMVRWGPLHLTHLAPWMWQTPAMWPHFQQFLHCRTSRFIFALCTVAIKLLTLKHLLMIFFVLEPFCMSQMSIQIMAISDFGETFIILGLEVRTMLLDMWLTLRILLTSSDKIHTFERSLM